MSIHFYAKSLAELRSSLWNMKKGYVRHFAGLDKEVGVMHRRNAREIFIS